MKQAIIVIDIGMTNKKIAVYDEHLVQRESVYKEFSPIMIKGPSGDIPTHDIDGMKKWFIENIRLFAKEYPVRAISVTAHGATFVCVDERGSVCVPCIFYTYEPGEDFHREFYEKCLAGVDIIYTPSKTRFMEMFLNKKVINGSKKAFWLLF